MVIIDATEQRVARSRDNATQKTFCPSKKAHIRKTVLVVNAHERLRFVNASAPGSIHDLTL